MSRFERHCQHDRAVQHSCGADVKCLLARRSRPMTVKVSEVDLQSQRRGWLGSILQVPGGGIATAVLLRVVLFSTLVTLILTVLQLSLSYQNERQGLESRFREIDEATSRSLSESLWALDTKLIQEQLE